MNETSSKPQEIELLALYQTLDKALSLAIFSDQVSLAGFCIGSRIEVSRGVFSVSSYYECCTILTRLAMNLLKSWRSSNVVELSSFGNGLLEFLLRLNSLVSTCLSFRRPLLLSIAHRRFALIVDIELG